MNHKVPKKNLRSSYKAANQIIGKTGYLTFENNC